MPSGLLPQNPYIAGNPVGNTPAFVGREDVLREVLRVLRHPHENAITLYGQRRIGKTSVLQWLEAHLPDEGPYLPVYFDLMSDAGRPLGEILQMLAASIARTLKLPRPNLAAPAEAGFRTWLESTLNKAVPAAQALVLLMDEFDVHADPEADKEAKKAFFGYMRDLRHLNPARLQFVFVLGRTLDDLDIVAKGLFKDLPSKRVSLFSREEAERVVRLSEREGSLTWQDDAVARVWDWAGGHPYLTQALCAEVWERAYEAADAEGLDAPPPVTPEAVDAAMPASMRRSENMFTWLWEGLGPAERIVAAALAAAGPQVVDEDDLTRILNEAGVSIVIRELRDAPRLLQNWDILAPTDGGYRFRVEMLRRWIAEHKPLSRVQDELDRINPVAENLYQAAWGLFRNRQWEQAIGPLRQVLGMNPNHLGAHELLAEALLAQGDLDAAQETLERLLALAPGRAKPRLKQIYLQRAQGEEDPEARLPWYEKVLGLYPEDPQALEGIRNAWVARGERALAAENLQDALEAFEQALTYGDEPQLRKKVAEIERLLAEQKIEERLAEIRDLEARKDYAVAYEKMQALAEEYPPQARDWEAELARLQRLSTLETKYQQALAKLEVGEGEAAKQLLAQVVGLDPEYKDALQRLHEIVRPTSLEKSNNIQKESKDSQEKAKGEEPPLAKEINPERPSPSLSPWAQFRSSQHSAHIPTSQKKSLSHHWSWYPLSYPRLLWWALVTPQQLQHYRKRYGENAKHLVNGLAYTLVFLPLLFPLWGLALGLLPLNVDDWYPSAWRPNSYGWWSVVASGIWILLSAFDVLDMSGVFLVAFIVTVGMASGVAPNAIFIATVVAGVMVASGTAIGVTLVDKDDVVGVVGDVVAAAVATVMVFGMERGGGFEIGMAIFILFTISGILSGNASVGGVGFILGLISGGIAGELSNRWFAPYLGKSITAIALALVAFVVTFIVGEFMASNIANIIRKNIKSDKPTRWALALLALSWAALLFFSLGGLTWLQTGVWPTPVWPF